MEDDLKPFKTVAILGDFNLNLINYSTHPGTYEFVNNFQTYAYIPCINVPTRITERSQTLIDNIFVRCRSGITKAAVIYYDLSDHLPIVAVLKTKLTFKTKKTTLLKRNFTDYALANFNEELSTPQLWDGLSCTSCTNAMFDSFHCTFSNCFEKHFPLLPISVKHRNSPRQSWMTHGLVNVAIKK